MEKEKTMSTTVIRQKLHSYLEIANDKKVKALYTMMQEDIEVAEVKYPDEFQKELDNRYADYKTGKVKALTATQSHKRVQKILKNGKSK